MDKKMKLLDNLYVPVMFVLVSLGFFGVVAVEKNTDDRLKVLEEQSKPEASSRIDFELGRLDGRLQLLEEKLEEQQ